MKIRGKGFLSLLMPVFVLFVIAGCSGSKSGSSSSKHLGTANIKIGFSSGGMQHASKFGPKHAAVAVGTVNDVTLVTVDIKNGLTVIVQGTPLSYNNGAWSATINELPVGEQLTIIAHAYNSANQEIFTGETLQTMSGADDHVEIAMAPVSNGATLDFPGITQVSRPSEILVSGTALVSISMQGSAGETLTYEIIVASNGGTISPSSGSITLVGTSATLVFDYTAPEYAGQYIHSVRVTNSLGSFVETTFDTNIAAQLAQNAVSVLFNPVVTKLSAVRTGTNVTVTADVSDTGPSNELVYEWSFSGGEVFTFADPTVNPAVLNASGSLFFGTLGLTVTNGAGRSTSVSYKLAFPKVSSIMLLPQAMSSTRIEDCRVSTVSGNIVALAISERGDKQDYNNDGDTDDTVLGYMDVTQGNVVNTGIVISRNSVAIDGDIIVFQYPTTYNYYSEEPWYSVEYGTLGYYSISTQTEFDTEITPDGFGRSSNGITRQVSNGKIAFIATIRDLDGDGINDSELQIYDTSTQTNTPTGVRNVGNASNQPSISGNIVAFTDSQDANQNGRLKYYNITTGETVDTQIDGTYPTIDNGTIAYFHSSGYVAYYDIANQKNVITPIPPMWRNWSPSISNGIIAAVIRENDTWGDLDGSGILGDDDSGILVLYDIATGKMISTGLVVCCGPDISGDLIAYEIDESSTNRDLDGDGVIRNACIQVYFRINDLVKQYFGR